MIRTAIRKQIGKQHLDIATLAPVAGISAMSLHKYLIGKVSIEYDPAIKLMVALGISFGYKRVGVAIHSADNCRTYIQNILTERSIKTHNLSVLTGVNYCTLSSWLNGKRQITLKNLELVLKALGLEVLELQ